MARRPPEILITTPESLNVLLSSRTGRAMLTGIATVILDEIHAVVGTKRGTHLITAVERLVLLTGEFQRIALSATVRPLAAVAEFVGGSIRRGDTGDGLYEKRPVAIVASGDKKRTEIRVSFPADAREPRLSFFPGFLQGGAHFQIRYGLPADQIKALHSRFSSEKTKSFFGGDTNAHMNQTNGMPTTSFYTGTDGRRDFPADYEIMIFDPVLTNRPPGFYWNHGRSHGVAISTAKNDIVYWAEAW